MRHVYSISTSTFFRFFAIVIAFIVAYIIRDIIFALFFAVIIASALEPSIAWLKRRGIARILGVVLVYLVAVLLLAFVVYLILPVLFDEIVRASSSFALLQSQILEKIERVGGLTFGTFFAYNLQQLFGSVGQNVSSITAGIVAASAQLFGGLFSFFLVVVFSFYLAAQERGIENFLRMVAPVQHEPYIIEVWGRAQRKLGKWFRAQLLLAAIVGVCIFIGLTMLGIPHALLLAFMAGMFEIIPVVGPILAAVPAVATGFITSPVTGLMTLGLYVLVQQMESHLLIPIVMRKAVGLSPLVVVIALLVGAKLGGIFGILMAVPITAIAAELLSDWDKKRRAIMPE